MTFKEKYNSIDQTKLPETAKAYMVDFKKDSNNFTNKEAMAKMMPALDKFIAALKDSGYGEAIKGAAKKETKKKAETPTEMAKEIVEDAIEQPKTKTGKPKVGNISKGDFMKIAKEIRKEGESWNDAMKRAGEIIRKQKEGVKTKAVRQYEKLKKFIAKHPEVYKEDIPVRGGGFRKTTLEVDAPRIALPRGKRVSRKGWKNQYGKSEGGKTYYEYRSNRYDTNRKRYPFLAKGGEINERMYNFLVDDLASLKVAINENDTEKIEQFFSYWNIHLKSLKPEMSSARMYHFLEDDLAKLESAINDNDNEEIEKFFSYWDAHLSKLKYAEGGETDALYTKLLREYETEGYPKMGISFKTFIESKKETAMEKGDYEMYRKLFDVLDAYEGDFYAKGGETTKLEAGVYRVGKPIKVSPILYEQKIVEIFDNGDIATASDYGRKLSDFSTQNYAKKPVISQEILDKQYHFAKGGEMDYYEQLAVYVQGVGSIYNGSSMKKAIEKANSYLAKKPNAEVVIVDEKYGDEYDLDGNLKEEYAKGGSISKSTTYVPNRDVKELMVVLKGELTKLKGKDILDGVYVKNKRKPSPSTESPKELLAFAKKKASSDRNGGKVAFDESDIQLLLDAGLSAEDVKNVLIGYTAPSIQADTEFGKKTYGIINYSDDVQKNFIAEIASNAKKGYFEIGMKYPNDFNWKPIIEKFGISSTPKIVQVDLFRRKTKYEVYLGKGVAIGHQFGFKWNDDKKWSEEEKYGKLDSKNPEFKGGYWGVVTKSVEDMYFIVDTLLKQSAGYLKDLDMFRNGLGGVDIKGVENLKFAKGGEMEDKMSFEEFEETLQEYEIEGGFGKTIEKGYKMYYLPNNNPYLNTKFNHRNKRKAYQEYLKMSKYAKGGEVGFKALSDKVAKYYSNKSVPSKYQSLYGKKYDKSEAKEVGDKVAAKVYRQQLAKKK